MVSISFAIIVIAAVCIIIICIIRLKESNDRKIREKIEQYEMLLTALSDLMFNDDKKSAIFKFATIVNKIALVAPYNVIEEVMILHNEINMSNVNTYLSENNITLTQLLKAIRADIGTSDYYEGKTFLFHLIPPISESDN